MKKKDKYLRTVTLIEYFEVDDCTIEDLILRLQEVKANYPDVSNCRLYNNVYYSDFNFEINGERLETDEEYNKRIEKSEKRKSTIKKKELAQLAKLEAKYRKGKK